MKSFFSSLWILALAASWVEGQIPNRVENTTLDMPAEMFSSVDYELEDLSPGEIGHPVALVSPPGDNRLFVVDRVGIIRVIDDLDSPSPAVFLDIRDRVDSDFLEEGLLGLAFHPDFASNGTFFVFYTRTNSDPVIVHDDTLSRFQLSSENSTVGDPASETILIRQPGNQWSQNHNGGDLHFTDDGYLLVSLGDGGISSNSQQIDGDFRGAMLRLDVDGHEDSLSPNTHPASVGNYWIPPDNPFVGATSYHGSSVQTSDVRTEIFALGLRNPWRFSVDSVTDQILLGDVGEGSAEEINLIESGGNFGWPFREGFEANSGTPPSGATFLDPIHAYDRDDGLSVIGGFIYRGNRFPELNGRYVFTDWGNGEIRALIPNGQNPVSAEVLASSFGFGPSAFGPDPRNGDILVAHGSIRRLVRSDEDTGEALPTTLTATGAFSDLSTLSPNPGIVPYQINVPFWSDDGEKSRWFSVPATDLQMGFGASSPFVFPTSTVWIKHFEIEMTEGNPASRRRLETRFLVKTEAGIYGVTYRWNAEETEAFLVPEEGTTEVLDRIVGGSPIAQTWTYPSRSDCLSCHSPAAGWALGFDSGQLNRETPFGGESHNQLLAFHEMGYFDSAIPSPDSLMALSDAEDNSASLEHRVRSYLQANCAQCHRDGAIATWDARISTPMENAGILNGLLNDNGGNPDNRVVVPGVPNRSMLLTRISTRGAGQMPPLASHVVDSRGVELVTEWIQSLAGPNIEEIREQGGTTTALERQIRSTKKAIRSAKKKKKIARVKKLKKKLRKLLKLRRE